MNANLNIRSSNHVFFVGVFLGHDTWSIHIEKLVNYFEQKNPPRHFSQFKANNEMKNVSGNS